MTSLATWVGTKHQGVFIGASVRYYGRSTGQYVDTTVKQFHSDGTVTLDAKARADPSFIFFNHEDEALRSRLPKLHSLARWIGTPYQDAFTGADVRYFSGSFREYFDTKVIRINSDGTVKLGGPKSFDRYSRSHPSADASNVFYNPEDETLVSRLPRVQFRGPGSLEARFTIPGRGEVPDSLDTCLFPVWTPVWTPGPDSEPITMMDTRSKQGLLKRAASKDGYGPPPGPEAHLAMLTQQIRELRTELGVQAIYSTSILTKISSDPQKMGLSGPVYDEVLRRRVDAVLGGKEVLIRTPSGNLQATGGGREPGHPMGNPLRCTKFSCKCPNFAQSGICYSYDPRHGGAHGGGRNLQPRPHYDPQLAGVGMPPLPSSPSSEDEI